jgi:GNAT superfamily N-acetyltransferase
VPLSVLAVRTGDADAKAPECGAAVRRARPADLDGVVALAMAEMRYSARVGGTVLRPDAEAMKRTALRYRLTNEADPVWLAESRGSVTGLAECTVVDVPTPRPFGGARYPVRPGRWGYVNCLSVPDSARHRGVGRSLMARAHGELSRLGTRGSYLYFNPANPLSSVFWPRQGYRPLWTVWEVRPARALR